jgi:hypothetical protein
MWFPRVYLFVIYLNLLIVSQSGKYPSLASLRGAAQRSTRSIANGFRWKNVINKENLLSAKMSKTLFVCVRCAQDFTREYGANRHNDNHHLARSLIVDFKEYIIGRIKGTIPPPTELPPRLIAIRKRKAKMAENMQVRPHLLYFGSKCTSRADSSLSYLVHSLFIYPNTMIQMPRDCGVIFKSSIWRKYPNW